MRRNPPKQQQITLGNRKTNTRRLKNPLKHFFSKWPKTTTAPHAHNRLPTPHSTASHHCFSSLLHCSPCLPSPAPTNPKYTPVRPPPHAAMPPTSTARSGGEVGGRSGQYQGKSGQAC